MQHLIFFQTPENPYKKTEKYCSIKKAPQRLYSTFGVPVILLTEKYRKIRNSFPKLRQVLFQHGILRFCEPGF